jgi:hypothetical protein
MATLKLPRRNFLHLAAGAAALPTASRFAWAQACLSRPVRLIVPLALPARPFEAKAQCDAEYVVNRLRFASGLVPHFNFGLALHRRVPFFKRRQQDTRHIRALGAFIGD